MPDALKEAVVQARRKPDNGAGSVPGTEDGHGFVSITAWRSEAIRWMWEDKVPLGEMTLFAGMEKVGKSALCCELAARATRGQLDGDLYGTPIRVLYLTAEDRIGHVIKPRMQLAGADLDLVMVQAIDDNVVVTVSRIDHAIRDGVRLVILDPLVAYLDGLDDEASDIKLRSALGPIIHIAQTNGAALVGIKHLNKSAGRKVLDRVSGGTPRPSGRS